MSHKRITRSFYSRPSPVVAPELLGALLHRKLGAEVLVGRIVETEAYASYDPASHSFRGKTSRNAIMFGEAGFSYVYFTYGMHYCFNVSCEPEGIAQAVLIRALEPVSGIETMKKHRTKAKRDVDLANGPGKLCQALSMTRSENGIDLVTSDEVFLTEGSRVESDAIGVSSRVGISVGQEYPWRFFIKENAFVSSGRPSAVSLE